MHCVDSQIVSGYISTIVPDDNQKLLINEKQHILLVLPVEVVSIRKTFATSYRVCFLFEFEATSHNAMFVGRWDKCIYP